MKDKYFVTDLLMLKDASSLCMLMVSNKDRFQRFFPKTMGQNLTIADSEAFIVRKQREMQSRSEYTYAIREAVNGCVVGLIILKELDWTKKQGELAYCIDSHYEGKGWVTKTVREISSHAFNDLGLKTLQIIAHKSNKGSIKVAEKCGYTWQKPLLKSHIPPNEAPLDMELYELNR